MRGERGAIIRSRHERVRQGGASAGQVPMPILLGLLAVSAVAAVLLFVWGSHLQQEMTVKQQSIEKLTANNEELQQQLNSIEQERKQLDSRLRDLKTQLASASEELGKLKDVQLRYDILKDEKNRLEVQMTQLKQERDDSKTRLAHLEQEHDDLEHTAGRLRNRLTLLDRDYQQLAGKVAQLEHEQASAPVTMTEMPASSTSSSPAMAQTPPVTPAVQPAAPSPTASPARETQTIELPPIVVGKEEALVGTFPVRGRVVEVNEAHRFVVVDQGSDQSVQMGMTFDVLHGNRTIGQAVVVRVRPRIAACDVVTTASEEAPHVGDLVIQRGP